jgi:acetyltransferase-like isoleucine patch superfamily enzyme
MRKDHRPYGVHRLQKRLEAWLVSHFLEPQLDECGTGLEIIGARWVSFSGPKIRLGQHVHMMALRDAPIRLAVFEGMGEISVGDHVLMNPGVRIVSAESITIGKDCMLAMHCHLSDADWHDVDHRIFAPGKTRAIHIGDNVWLGDGVRVLKGVTIGDNTIVGAGSVVTKSLPDDVIAGGNPAVVIGELGVADRSTRGALFNMDQPYDDFSEAFMRSRLEGNRWSGWLKSLLKPGPRD